MTDLTVVQIHCLSDNYAVLLHSPGTQETLLIDAPDAGPVDATLEQRGWRLTEIFITHHHTDHTAGIPSLKKKYGCKVTGPASEADRISSLDRTVSEGFALSFSRYPAAVIETPGHTLGHVCYHFEGLSTVFTGDTLFSLGCGRIFEGDPEAMWGGLKKLAALPGDTKVYCGHEYTLANAKFALSVEPENRALVARAAEVEELRRNNSATLPTTMAQEIATNPFLRANSPAIRSHLGLQNAADWQVFARLRELKNKA